MPELLSREAAIALWGSRLGAQLWHYRRVYPGYDPTYVVANAASPVTDDRVEAAVRNEAHHIWEDENKPDGCADRHWCTARARVDAALLGTPRMEPKPPPFPFRHTPKASSPCVPHWGPSARR